MTTGEDMPKIEKTEAVPEHKTPLDALSREWSAKLEHRLQLADNYAKAEAELAAWDQALLDHAHQVRNLADGIFASHPSAPPESSATSGFVVPPGTASRGEWRRTLSRRPQSPDSPHPGWTEPQGLGPDVTGPLGGDTAQMPSYDGRETPTEPIARMEPPTHGTHRADEGEGRGRQTALWVMRTAALITITLLATLICLVMVFPNSILSNAVGQDLVPFGAMTAILLVPLAVEVSNPLQRWLGPYWSWLRGTTYAVWGLIILKLLMLHPFWPDFVGVWYVGVVVVAGLARNRRVALWAS